MARIKKTEETEEIQEASDTVIDNLFESLSKINPESAFLNENALSNVNEWVDTGSMALNAIISGSLYGGIPKGRVTIFTGPEACGKTFIVNKIIANAQNKNGMRAVYFDSENALDSNTAVRLGCDAGKIRHCPIEIIEECKNQIVKFLNNVAEKKAFGKFIIIIDSLGNLISAQEKKNLEEGALTKDMGNRAAQLKAMLRAITHAAARSQCPVVCTNHIYDDPAQLHKSALKQQAGGKGPLYMGSVIVQLGKKVESDANSKSEESTSSNAGINKGYNGVLIRSLTTKNRFVIPYLEAELYLNFKTGLNRFSGLLDMLESYNVLTRQHGGKYALGDEKIGTYKEWRKDKSIWDKILPSLEQALKDNLEFKKHDVDDDEFEDDVDSEDVELKEISEE